MGTSNDYPGLKFVQAKGYTRGRPDGRPLWIVWHTMEVDELPDRAENTAAYFANPGDGREVSSHYCVDSNSAVQCVDEDDTAWTVGNRAGNNRGINFELAGRAAQTRAQWTDDYSRRLLAVAAPIAAHAMKRWHIPNRWCTQADLKALRPGHTTHNALRIAYGGTTHTDPGPGFPTDLVMQLVGHILEGDTDMPLSDADVTKVTTAVVKSLIAALPGFLGRDLDGSYLIWRTEAITRLREQITVHLPDGTTDTEANELALLLHRLDAAASSGGTLETAALIAAIRDEGDKTRQAIAGVREDATKLLARLAQALTSGGAGSA